MLTPEDSLEKIETNHSRMDRQNFWKAVSHEFYFIYYLLQKENFVSLLFPHVSEVSQKCYEGIS